MQKNKYYALAVRQPWASLIASGQKTIEVRPRPWHYRGPVIICASARPVIKHNDSILPTAAAIAIVDMLDCRLLTSNDLAAACMSSAAWPEVEGCYAWVLSNAREIKHIPGKWIVAPWPWRGAEPALV